LTHKYDFVAELASSYPLTLLCRIVGVTRSGYYAWRARVPSAHTRSDAVLTAQITTIFNAARQTYGSPRVQAELRAQGLCCARKRVARLMRQAGLVARSSHRCVRTTRQQRDAAVAPNRLARQFHTDAPNQVWVADITYLATRAGWLYLAVVLDLYARRVVGWSMQPRLTSELAQTALKNALAHRRPPVGLLHHSDRGSTYTSQAYQAQVQQAGALASMSRTGDCWDNSVVESFFASMKAELGQRVFATQAEARAAVFDYIERFYNRQRRHSSLGYLSPVAYERRFAATLQPD
jgi:transposase InsO family protein